VLDEIVVVTVVDVAVEDAAVIVVVVVEVVVGFGSCKRRAVNVVVVGTDSVVDVVEVIIDGEGMGENIFGPGELDPPEVNIKPIIKKINPSMNSLFFIIIILFSNCLYIINVK
jgi:hypothetical protein